MIFLRLGITHHALPRPLGSKFRAASGPDPQRTKRLAMGPRGRRTAAFAALVLLACGGAGDGRTGAAGTTADSLAADSAQRTPGRPAASGGGDGGEPAQGPDAAPFGDAPVVRSRAGAPPVLMTAVRSAAHDGFDRIVLEFADGLPGFRVEYVDGAAYQCGSGEAARVEGAHRLRLRVEPAAAHTEAGAATVADRDRRPDLPVLVALALTCDFEAQVEWVAGLRSRRGFRVLELAQPPRLVVDVRG
jgi:hypothetical protein